MLLKSPMKAYIKNNREFFLTFLMAVAYGVGLYLLQFFLHQRDMVPRLPNADDLVQMDAGWYESIIKRGYEFYDGPSNTAFYMLFPKIWQLVGMNFWAIVSINACFFAFGFALFTRMYPL